MLKSFVRRPAIVGSTRAILGAAAVVGIALAAAASANAATIIETFSFPTVDGVNTVDGSSFAAFDPALGTLNSIIYDLNVTATFSGGGESDNNVGIYGYVFEGPGGQTGIHTAAFVTGNTSHEVDLTLGEGGTEAVALFIGPGLVHPSVVVSQQGPGSASLVSTFATESVTYSYTPATPAAPEPSTWAMMGLGFAALAFAGYRKTRRPAATAA